MKIVCFGDSNTYGYDPRGYLGGRYDPENRWVDLLAQRTGWTFYNRGRNGRTIPGGPVPLPDADLLVVMLGTNDLLQGASAPEAAARMGHFLKGLSQKQILLVAPPPMKRGAWVPTDALIAESTALAEEYRRLAQAQRLDFLDAAQWHVALAFDGVHFTEEGHHAFADALEKELRR